MRGYKTLNKMMKCVVLSIVIIIMANIREMSAKPLGGDTIPSCREEGYRKAELVEQGYDITIASDQAAEEYGRDGYYGTGGIHGKLLNGTPAPNAGMTFEQIMGDKGTGNVSTGSTSKEVHTHKWTVLDNVEATCQKEGYIKYACTGCGKEKTEKTAKTEHDLTLVKETPGNCSTFSVREYKCDNCDYTEEQKGELGEHDFVVSENSTKATCTEAGYEKKKCSICGKEEEGPTDPLGHSYATTITILEEASCTKDGSQGYLCSTCGDVKDYKVIPAKGHTPGEPVREEAGLFNTGTIHTYCTTCHSLLEEEIIPAKVNPAVPAGIFVVIVIIVSVLVIRRAKKGKQV